MSDEREFERQMEANRKFYEAHAGEIKQTYAGQYVGIAFGRVVAADPDFFAVCLVVDQMAPKPEHLAVFHSASEPAFEPITCYYQGEFLPWDESLPMRR